MFVQDVKDTAPTTSGPALTTWSSHRHFADGGLFPFVRDGWQQVFMANPTLFGLLLMAGESVLGVLLLLGGRAAVIGWVGVITFHVLLMLFGFGFWVWCVPALVTLGLLARRDTSAVWTTHRAEGGAQA